MAGQCSGLVCFLLSLLTMSSSDGESEAVLAQRTSARTSRARRKQHIDSDDDESPDSQEKHPYRSCSSFIEYGASDRALWWLHEHMCKLLCPDALRYDDLSIRGLQLFQRRHNGRRQVRRPPSCDRYCPSLCAQRCLHCLQTATAPVCRSSCSGVQPGREKK